MREIRNPRLLFTKAALFVSLGLVAAGLLVVRAPRVSTVVLLTICVWAFARAYYFLFYVITHYIDPSYRYAGIVSAIRHLIRKRIG